MIWQTDTINFKGTIWRRNAIDRVHWRSRREAYNQQWIDLGWNDELVSRRGDDKNQWPLVELLRCMFSKGMDM